MSTLYLVACAAPPARDIPKFVSEAKEAGWDVCVLTTPHGRAFVDVPALQALTGHLVWSEYKRPDDPDELPPPDVILVAPITFNTLNKWALGITDTLVVGLLAEAIGKRTPVIAVPWLNTALAKHPAFTRSIDQLRDGGVQVLDTRLPEPGSGPSSARSFPWESVLAALPSSSQ
jgi:phosphopantothenoylcysteine synthetase/decarboxylase